MVDIGRPTVVVWGFVATTNGPNRLAEVLIILEHLDAAGWVLARKMDGTVAKVNLNRALSVEPFVPGGLVPPSAPAIPETTFEASLGARRSTTTR
tara:strand:+ start:3613 stop:3897 length:285 start_codon:yes stop_codon:yes gene_type:complete